MSNPMPGSLNELLESLRQKATPEENTSDGAEQHKLAAKQINEGLNELTTLVVGVVRDVQNRCDPASDAAAELDRISSKFRLMFQTVAEIGVGTVLNPSPNIKPMPDAEKASKAFHDAMDEMGVDALLDDPDSVAKVLSERLGTKVIISKAVIGGAAPEDKPESNDADIH